MKFAVCTNKPAAKPTAAAKTHVAPITPEDITEAYEGMMTAYMELTDAERNFDEVCQVMENIELSMKMIKASDKAIECLNIDGSLEALCGCEAKLITVDKSLEGLSDTLKEGWKKFCEYVKNIIAKITEFFKKFLPVKTVYVEKQVEKVVEKTKELTPAEAYSKKNKVVGDMVKFTSIPTIVKSIQRTMDILEWNYTAPTPKEGDDPQKMADDLYKEYGAFINSKVDGKLLISRDGALFLPAWYSNKTTNGFYLCTGENGTSDQVSLSDAGYNNDSDVSTIYSAVQDIMNIEKKLGSFLNSTFRMNEESPGVDHLVIKTQFTIATHLSKWIAGAINDLSKTLSVMILILTPATGESGAKAVW